MAAVTQHGRALEHAAEPLKADKEVVVAAVTQNGNALAFAAVPLQDLGMPAYFAHQLVLNMFKQWDVDESGFIEEHEMSDFLGLNPDDAREVFASADTSKDGKIDYEEFFAWVYGSDEARRALAY